MFVLRLIYKIYIYYANSGRGKTVSYQLSSISYSDVFYAEIFKLARRDRRHEHGK